MSTLDIGINVSDIKKVSNVFPAQLARMRVDSMSLEMNKTDDIQNLNLRLTFVGGPLDGRSMFVQHPVKSTRPTMTDMVASSLERVKELGEACGVSGSDLAPCLHKEIDVTIGVSKPKGDYPAKNQVNKYATPKAPAKAASTAPAFLAKKKAPAAKVEEPKVEEPKAEDAPLAGDLTESDLPF